MHRAALFAKLHGCFGVLDVDDGVRVTHLASERNFVTGFQFGELGFRREFRSAFSRRKREGSGGESENGERGGDDGLDGFHVVDFLSPNNATAGPMLLWGVSLPRTRECCGRQHEMKSARNPRLPPPGMTPPMKDSHDRDEIGKNPINNQVGELSWQAHASLTIDDGKNLRLPRNQGEARINTPNELSTQTDTTTLIPDCRLRDFSLRLISDDNRQAHKLDRIRSRAISHGVPAPGCASKASRRRSNSEMCSGVRPIAGASSAIVSHRSSTS